jgi:hypothetical protein
MMTPQEAARACKSLKETPDNPEVEAFLKRASARDLQTFIHLIQIVDRQRYFSLARVALDIRLSEDAEKSTRRIIWLTRGLLVLTIGLLVFTAALYYDTHLQIVRDNATNHAATK